MKKHTTDLQRYAQKIALRAAERREIRERLLSYMEYHPLQKQNKKKLGAYIESEYFTHIGFNTWYFRSALGFFIILFVVIVPVAAERSVPGDVLYPVKVRINEEVRAGLTLSPYEKVVWETQRLERRIAEARLLASEGKLTEKVEEEISKTVKAHADAAQKGIDEIRATDADEAAVAQVVFESALEVQSAVLDTDPRASTSEETTDTTELAATVKQAKESSAAAGVNASSTLSYERFLARVEVQKEHARGLFATIDEAATENERKDIARRLEDIERAITDIQTIHEEGQTGDAVTMLRKELSDTQKLISFMTDIDVRANVALETLVPVQLTNEERVALASEIYSGILAAYDDVEAHAVFIEEESLREKVTIGFVELDRYIEQASSTRALGDVGGFENAIAEAGALISDLQQLTADVIVPEETIKEGESVSEETGTSGTSTEVIAGEI